MRQACLLIALTVALPFTAHADTGTKTTDTFVRMCDAAVPDMKCLLEYETVTGSLNWPGGDPKHATCEPEVPYSEDQKTSNDLLRVQVLAVVKWLKQNPGYGAKSEMEGIEAALHAIYPCK